MGHLKTGFVILGAVLASLSLTHAALADTYVVNDLSDLPDVTPGDGLCATALGTCTLRAAVQEANAHAGGDSITLPAGTITLTRTGSYENNALTGDLDLRDALTITGAGRDLTIINGNLNDRVFDILPTISNSPLTVTLSALTARQGGTVGTGCEVDITGAQTNVTLVQVALRDGACASSYGYGALYSTSSKQIVMSDVIVANNQGYYAAVQISGGTHVFNQVRILQNTNNGGSALRVSSATLYMERSALVGNTGQGYGGGLNLYNTAGAITNTTFAENIAASGGGLYVDYSSVGFTNNTLVRNTATSYGGGLYLASSSLYARNTLIADNGAPSGPDAYCYGYLYSQGSLLIGDNGYCDSNYRYTSGPGDLIGVNAGVAATLNNNGDWVAPLLSNSPAIDAGSGTCPAADGRGMARPQDGDGNGSATCDIGAYEHTGPAELSLAGLVFSDIDQNGVPGVTEPGVRGVTVTLRDLGSGALFTATTGARGGFGFGQLMTGTYAVVERQPVGYDDGLDALGTAGGVLGPDAMTVTLAYGTSAISYTFGELPYTVITGVVYIDTNADGQFTPPSEGGLSGIGVSLAGTSSAGQPIAQAITTDGYGYYAFINIPPGTYTVTEAQPVGYFDGPETLGSAGGALAGVAPDYDVMTGIAVTYGVPVTGYLFAEYNPRSVSANVFIDYNANGVADGYEDGIPGVTITLTGVTYRGAAVSLAQVSSSSGNTSFYGLAPGVYTLTEQQPITYADGLDAATGSGLAGNDVISSLVVTGSIYSTGGNFGELPAGVSGVVYLDANANGRLDNESGVNGATVWLSGIASDGAGVWMTATTDSRGRFLFPSPPTGTYTLNENQPAAYLDGFEQVGAGGGITGAIGSDLITGIYFTPTVAGQWAAAAGYLFAEIPSSSLEGFVYLDADNNQYLSSYGSCPASCDPPLMGVTMVLTGVNDLGESVWLTTTTVTGTMPYYSYIGARFVFTPLRPGVYSIIELQPFGYVDGPVQAGSPWGVIGRNRIDVITLTAGTQGSYYNFGEYPAALSGYVYLDANNDGEYRRGSESTLSSVYITLTWVSVTGSLGTQVGQTDGYGRYSFTNLVTGVYTIAERQPSSYADGRETIGDLPATVSNDLYAGIAYTPGVGAGNFNFGELYPASLNVAVYWDRDGNGAFDYTTDTGITGVTLTLTGTNDVGMPVGPIVLNTGSYNNYVVFNNLGPGVYSVFETQPSGGYVDGPSIIGNYFGGVPGSNRIDGITIITPGISAYNYAFTEFKAGVSGFVYLDANNNQHREGSETSYPGQETVVISATDGGSYRSSMLIGFDGYYLFANVPTGQYLMTTTQSTGVLDNYDQPGTVAGVASGTAGALGTDIITGIAYVTGTIGLNYNFGEINPSHIRGTVYQDLNANGYYDYNNPPYDFGLRGVTVTLTGVNDVGTSIYLTRTTDSSGAFDFDTLRPGLYTLTETQPLTYTDGAETSGYPAPAQIGNDRFQGITVTTPGSNFTGYLFGELLPGLYGFVYRDGNNDGIFSNYYDSGLYNVQVILSGTTAAGTSIYSTTLTDGTGRYLFAPLLTGTYTLIEPQPTGYLDGIDSPGNLGGITSTLGNGNDLISGIPITVASYGRDYNFGELYPAQIYGIVFLDLNGDGYYAYSEPGIVSATLTLSGTNDRGQPVLVVTYTNSTGNFTFANLRPGTYTLSETQPSGYLDGQERSPAGTLSVVNDTFSAISVVAGNSYGQYQFGESGSFLSGYVYQDRNNDGIRSGYNETGISNVTVYLTGTRSDNGTTVGRVSTTDSAGVYQFTNVPNGVYTITEVQPAGYFDGRETLGVGAGGVISNNDRFNLITMSGPGGTNYNFGEIGPSTFGGVVFFDINDDGNRDGNEPGISGVTVYLRGTDYLTLPVWMTTTTDANGSFNFTNVRMGVYTVTEVQPAAYLDGKDKVGCCGGGTLGNDAVSSVTVLGADTLAFFYFGERISGLSGYVYQDNNNNGLRDDSYGSYGGVSGAAMTLYGFTTLGQAVTRTTTSDSYGFYYFNDLLTGTYRLSETQPSPWLDGREAAGGLGGTPGPNDVIDNIAFIPGQYGSDYNFGEFYASSLSGIVYWDVNNDGQKQLNEAGIVGATVVLSGTDDLNQGVRLTVTSSGGGAYGFSNLRPGTYALIEIQPGDYTDGLDAAGTVGGTPDGQDAITGIVVAPASSPNNYLFGERKLGITGYVYQDMNNDGARAPASEGGIANTLVTLDGTSLLGDAVSRVSVTNLYGFYTFGDLPAGAYVIHAFQPLGYLDGLEGIGSLGGLVGNDTFTVTYGAGQYGSEYNFGELPPASIQGTVYLDINGDAQQQNGEPGLPAVTLSLVGVNDLGATVSAMATTGGYGSFSFSGLRPGTYTITESQPEGYTDGNETVGALGGSVIGPDTIAAIPLGVGATAYNYRFGESQIGLGGLVYRDTDGDGFRDPFDPVLPGVTLILTGTPTVGAPITRTAQTDVFGFYRFGDVPAGTYRIREIQPPNLLDGPEFSASPSGTPGPLGEDFIDIAFTGVGFVDGFDFTEYSPNLLRGYVFFDLDNDALFRWAACGYDTFCVWDQNRAEVPVGAGVRIVLTGRNDLSQTLWMTDVTNSSGQYSFPLLRPGTYTLTEVQRDVDVDGLDQAMFAPEAIVANDQVRAISLTLGETKGANFGEKPSLMGYVFRDDNENVIWEASSATGCNSPEFGIGGVSMALTGVDVYNNNVNLAATTFTPAGTPPWRCQEGIFFWGGLVTGTYSIHETQPAGYLDGPEIVGTAGGLTTTNDIIARIVFTPGIVITGYGFSEQRNAIAGNVFVDTNDNGLMDGSEGGLVTPAVITLQGINNLGQSVNLSITTYGAYQFTGLRPGTYTLTESQPAGYADGKEQLGIGAGGALGVNDQFINLVLPPGTAATGYNFGELTSGSIGGRVAYVWYPNGLTWLGAGIGGETIRLNGTLNAGGTAAVTTTTDASGYYRFNGLAPGVYTVTHASFPTGYRDFGVVPCSGLAAGRSITNVVLQYGTDQSYCDFKLGPTLSGYVFADHNANGAQESGEPGLWSVGLTLFGALNGGGAFTQSVGTDATGYFAFGGLLTGTYRIIEFQPDGFFDGLDTPGSFGGLTGTLGAAAIPPGSLVITSDLIAGIIYTPNLIGVNYRFAELKPASLSGRVFFDMNDDGIYSSPPDGLASPVDVYLDGTNDLGEQIRMTNTDHAAVFNFTGLRPGSYTLTEIQPPTYTDWIDMVGTQGGVLTNDLIRYIPLGWGDVGTDYNFGERKYGLVGYVYADNDNNGVYEPPPGVDNGIPGAVVWLSGTTSLGAPVAFSTTTFNNGLFSFPELQPGVYTLTEMQPPGYADGIDALGTLGGVLSNDQVKLIALGDHAYGEGYLFGELAPSSLSGYVYVDLDNDGYRAGYGEPGIGGVTITLQGTSSLGDPVLMVTRTNTAGAYRFNAIPNGNYSLLEAQPAFADGIDRAGYGGAGGVALDDLIVGIGFNHILNATEYNFGERPSALSGRVFWDENGNGTRQITETGLSPATLKLHGVDFNGQPVLKTVKTGFDGYYAFEALPGTYWIEEIQPFGYLNGVALPGSLGGVIASPNVITQVVLGIGGSGQDYDFGEVAPTAVNLVQAMGLDLSALQGASLRTDLINKAGVGGLGTPTVAGFPTEGATFAYLGTGNMLFADQPNSSPNTFGLGDFAHLTLTVTVPTTATCLSFDFAFFSEEFPEFVGSAFNDGFDAFVDGRPVARDLNGNRISINSVFGATPANAAGSTYDAATPRLRAQAELTPGATSVISFTIADVTDTAYDSAVFIDKLRFSRPGGQGCAPGANLPISVALTKTVSVWPSVGNPVCGVTDTITVTAGTEVAYCYRATNTGEYTLTTHTLADTAFGTLFTALPQELLPGETYEFITSRVHTQSLVSVGSWTGTYSGTFNAVGSATTTVTIPGPAPTPTPVSPGSGFVSLQPIVVQTYLTAPVTITVMISGVTHLGGYETALRFDPAQVTVTAVSQAEFLTSTGRSLVALSTRTGPDYVRFGASTVGAASGPSGIGALARVRVSPRTVGTITLILSDTLATNEAGQAISLSVQNGALYVINPGKAYLPLVIR